MRERPLKQYHKCMNDPWHYSLSAVELLLQASAQLQQQQLRQGAFM